MNVNYLIIFAIWLLASIGCSASRYYTPTVFFMLLTLLDIVDDLVRVYYEMTEAAFARKYYSDSRRGSNILTGLGQ